MAVLKKAAEKDKPKQTESKTEVKSPAAPSDWVPTPGSWQSVNSIDDLAKPVVITERQERPSIPQVTADDPVLLKYDILRFPIGRMDFENAKRMFRDLRGSTDQKNLAQFVALLKDGYEIAPGGFVPAEGYAYFLFVKKS